MDLVDHRPHRLIIFVLKVRSHGFPCVFWFYPHDSIFKHTQISGWWLSHASELMEFVSWDDYIFHSQLFLESHKIPWLHSPPTRYCHANVMVFCLASYWAGKSSAPGTWRSCTGVFISLGHSRNSRGRNPLPLLVNIQKAIEHGHL